MKDDEAHCDIDINELTDRLKEGVDSIEESKKNYRDETDVLKKEDLEKFLIEKTGELVNEGLSTIRELKDVFVSNPNADEIESLSQAFKAVSSALSVLKDIQVTTMKNNSNKEIKEMDIKAKKELRDTARDNTVEKVYLTRDEVFKKLLDNSSVVDVDFVKEED